MRLLTVVIILLLGNQVAFAQVGRQAMAACASIEESSSRLECFDELAERHRLPNMDVPPATMSGTGEWSISRTINPIDDTATVVARLTATSGQGKYGDPVNMIIRCRSGEMDLYIDWHTYMTDSVAVTARVGTRDAVTENWLGSTDKQASFKRFPMVMIRKMLDEARFVAQATPFNENPITAIFDISGIDNALKPLREECDW